MRRFCHKLVRSVSPEPERRINRSRGAVSSSHISIATSSHRQPTPPSNQQHFHSDASPPGINNHVELHWMGNPVTRTELTVAQERMF
ncbi:hypothetical protein SRHO_G00087020 [Serrasalmus rhombeus]